MRYAAILVTQYRYPLTGTRFETARLLKLQY
jgi:hypothetical protein